MDMATLFKVDVDTLKKQQHDALKAAIKSRIQKFLDNLDKERYADCESMLDESPAGDGYGCENRYLDFSNIADTAGFENCSDGYDIGFMLDKLKALHFK